MLLFSFWYSFLEFWKISKLPNFNEDFTKEKITISEFYFCQFLIRFQFPSPYQYYKLKQNQFQTQISILCILQDCWNWNYCSHWIYDFLQIVMSQNKRWLTLFDFVLCEGRLSEFLVKKGKVSWTSLKTFLSFSSLTIWPDFAKLPRATTITAQVTGRRVWLRISRISLLWILGYQSMLHLRKINSVQPPKYHQFKLDNRSGNISIWVF